MATPSPRRACARLVAGRSGAPLPTEIPPPPGTLTSAESEKIVFGEAGHLHKVLQQSHLQRRVAMNRHRQAGDAARFAIDVMTAARTKKGPTVTFENASELLAADALI